MLMAAGPQPFLGVAASATGRRWRARDLDERLAAALSQRLDVPDIIGRVLAARGVGIDEAEHYLHPTLRHILPDPSLLPDMDVAAERLARAVREGERVAIFGDYDVDGATSAALLWRFLDAVGQRPLVHIPDRQREGYGPNAAANCPSAAAGARLVITVDCGTTALAPLRHAQAIGLDVIVVDHHLAEPELPPATAIVNANRVDVASPPGLRDLAAVGVAFLLAVAVNRALRGAGWYGGGRAEPDLMNLLDLVALGTVADVVPLNTLNRALVAQGLKVAGRRGNAGLAALADVAKLTRAPDAYHLGFILGPRVNAGGRIGASDLGVRLLTTADGDEARRLAEQLDGLNRDRQGIENEVYVQAMATVSRDGPLALAAGEGWHPGVIGIVAGRLKENLHRPALVIAIQDGVGKGSGRSIPGVDLGAAVTAARQAGLLINGGGHPMAAGLTVEAGQIAELGAFLAGRLMVAGERIGAAADLRLDGALAVGGVTAGLCDVIAQAGPFGAGNSEPRFAIPATRLVAAEVVGGQHVRCVLASPDGARLRGIAFRGMDGALGPALLRAAATALPWHVAGRLRAEEWRGERRVQFVIEDAAAA
jgi:single-stranded-DNA-specific exonuclease